ncbi:YibE/F family protein [Gordonia insulae]|uniref:YibE/F family protein n=1 Tax=Gordonia insulae TaxID=2420509 RepID=UPI000F5BD07D|nr:YibE/F family protein [Gordonia insulae]
MSHPGHGHGHSHSLAEIPAVLSPFARWVVIVSLTVIGLGVVVGAVALWPSGSDHAIPMQFRSADGGSIRTVDGHVVDQERADCLNPLAGTVQDDAVFQIEGVGAQAPCIQSTVQLDSGDDSGRHTLLEVPTNRAQSGTEPGAAPPPQGSLDEPQAGQPTLHVGDRIKLSMVPGPDGNTRYTFFDFQRTVPTLIWALLFVGAVVLVAAWRGLRSIIGLAFAFLVLGVFTLPAILDGESPVAVAVVSSAAILFVVLYLAHGVSLRTSSALLGTLVSLVLAGVLSWLAIDTMHLTGLSGDQTTNLQVYQGTISISGLLLAGFIIGTLGVLNDVTITQASAAFELAAAGEPTRLATFRAAMRVGRDHIASTVYTLVFAYAGSALPLLLLFSVAQQPFGSLITTDAVAVELARSFVGGIAIALSVPLTTVIAAALARPAGHPAQTAVGHTTVEPEPTPARPRVRDRRAAQIEPVEPPPTITSTGRHAKVDDDQV